ncbi:MAG: Ig-like domain repeat protein [Bdellovibrionales bacterium]|nr:Ig-like domain repeat protein [Bdellovibrionales bacterium]
MKGRIKLGRRGLIAFWLGLSFTVASYYNACGQVSFDQSSSARLQNMMETAQMLINNNDQFTNSDLVNLSLTSQQSDEVYVTNDPSCLNGGQWSPLNPQQNWTLGQLNTQARVYAKFRNTREGLETSCINDDIIHDDVKPEVLLASATAATNIAVPIVAFVATDTLSGLDKQFCEWPGQPVGNCNFSTSNGNLAEGRYLVKISASDRAGNVSDPKVHDLIVDRTPPVITILSSPAAISSNTMANYSFNVTDDRSGVKSVECSWENNTSYAACASPLAKNVGDGSHQLFIRATDKAGNSSEISHSFAVDVTAPTVTITKGPPDFSNVKTATFEFIGKDGTVDITKFECRLDNSVYASCSSPHSYSGLADGIHKFEVRGFDDVNNPSAPASRSWYVDTTPPAITFVKTPPALSNSTSAEFKYTITDAGSGVDKAQCSLNGAAYVDCPLDGMSYSGLAAGNHTFQVKGFDKAGNSALSTQVKFTIDLAKPTLQFTDTPAAISNLDQFNFKFLATDANGIDKMECRLDAGSFVACSTLTNHLVTGLTDGNHQFTIRATDKAGNVSDPLTYKWLVDLQPPVIAYYQSPPASLLSTQPLVFGFTTDDPGGSGVQSTSCTLNGAALACQSGVLINQTLPAGTYTVVITATDKAGNVATDTKTIVISAPVLKTENITINSNPKVDVLVVMDNSGSMDGEMANMASRMQNFMAQLNGLEWQLGIVTTDTASNAALKDGRMVPLKDNPSQYLLDYSMNPTTAKNSFAATIKMPTNGSGNENGFKATIRALERSRDPSTSVNAPNVALFRNDAALAVIVVSDSYDSSGTTPEQVIAKVKSYWPTKAFAFHSIVVPESQYTDPNATRIISGDPCGSYRESVQADGRDYHRLSGLTGGIKGTVCSDDYGSQLSAMGEVTADLVKSVSLACQPLDSNGDGKVDGGDVTVTGSAGAITGFTVSGNKLTFNNALPVGSVKFDYYCIN